MKILVICALVLLAMAIYLGLIPFLLMLVWNFVMPVFGLPEITFWHSLALCFLLTIIGGFFKTSK